MPNATDERKSLELTLPHHLEVRPGFQKLTKDCDLSDTKAALETAQDPATKGELQKLLDFCGQTWTKFPRMIIADMMRGEPPRDDPFVNLTDTILPKDRPN